MRMTVHSASETYAFWSTDRLTTNMKNVSGAHILLQKTTTFVRTDKMLHSHKETFTLSRNDFSTYV